MNVRIDPPEPVCPNVIMEFSYDEAQMLMNILYPNKDWLEGDEYNFEFELWQTIRNETSIDARQSR